MEGVDDSLGMMKTNSPPPRTNKYLDQAKALLKPTNTKKSKNSSTLQKTNSDRSIETQTLSRGQRTLNAVAKSAKGVYSKGLYKRPAALAKWSLSQDIKKAEAALESGGIDKNTSEGRQLLNLLKDLELNVLLNSNKNKITKEITAAQEEIKAAIKNTKNPGPRATAEEVRKVRNRLVNTISLMSDAPTEFEDSHTTYGPTAISNYGVLQNHINSLRQDKNNLAELGDVSKAHLDLITKRAKEALSYTQELHARYRKIKGEWA